VKPEDLDRPRDYPLVVLLRDGRPVEPEPPPAPAPPSRAGAWVAAMLLVAVAWLFWPGADDEPAAPPAAPFRMPAVAMSAVPVTLAIASTDASTDASTGDNRADDGAIELCGLGRLSAEQREDVDAWDKLMRAPVEQAMGRTAAALAAKGDERSRALALVLEGLRAGDAAAPGVWQDQLARIASATSDPAVYALGIQVCQFRGARRASCQMISAARWAQLDPDNAIVWLQVADDALARSDTAAFDDAMYRASKSSRSEIGFGQTTQRAVDHLPPDASPMAAWGVAAAVTGWEAARAIPGYAHVSKYCADAALADPNRRQVCDDLAKVLVDRSDALLDRHIGTTLGRRLGWPAERLADLQEERDAIAALQTQTAQAAMPYGLPTACAVVQADLQRLREMARHGELGALRQQLARAGVDRATLAARHRQSLAAVRSASAASAAAVARPASAPDAAASAPRPTL